MKDNRVAVKVYLDDDVLWALFHMAHERDITLNDLANEILKEAIEKWEKKSGESDEDSVRGGPGVGEDEHGKGPGGDVRDGIGAEEG